MPHITLETEKGRIHAPIPQVINEENFPNYMEMLKTAIQSISPQYEKNMTN
jgi:hypothetical protein